MSTLCGLTDPCTDKAIISIGIIMGILFGSLIAVAIIISIISIFCKKKKQAPTVSVLNPVCHAAVGHNQAMSMGSYPLNDQPFGFNEPTPAYQQENLPVVSSEKIEVWNKNDLYCVDFSFNYLLL